MSENIVFLICFTVIMVSIAVSLAISDIVGKNKKSKSKTHTISYIRNFPKSFNNGNDMETFYIGLGETLMKLGYIKVDAKETHSEINFTINIAKDKK